MLGRELKNRYRIVAALKTGGFGQTYIAEDTQRPGHPKCVVKHLMPATHNPQFMELARRLFNTEADTLEILGRHDRIPQLLAYFEDNQEFFLIQEFIDGYPLSEEMLPGKPLSEAKVILILEEVLNILTFIHSYGVIHRDIKPNNIMRRSHDGKLFLIDFGAVKTITTQLIPSDKSETPTIAIGTGGYMAPEQALGHPRLSSDIYSLGMTAIEALTGISTRTLPEDPDTGDLIWQDRTQVSHELAIVIDKMTARSLAQRYKSAAEVLEALKFVVNPTAPKTIGAPKVSTEAVTALDSLSSCNISLELQAALTSILADEIGPIAAIVINRNCSGALTSQALIEKLSTVVPLPQQERFRQKAYAAIARTSSQTPLQTSSAQPLATPVSHHRPVNKLEPSFIEFCQRELSDIVGPIGQLICQRAVKQNPNFSAIELVEFLVTQIPEAAKAAEFRQKFRF